MLPCPALPEANCTRDEDEEPGPISPPLCRPYPGVRRWLRWQGLLFNPFEALDAATDPYLARYHVQTTLLAALWAGQSSWVCAAPGAGKTALRVLLTAGCYVGQTGRRAFPIPYIPPMPIWQPSPVTLTDHYAALARAGASQLLLSLAYRPHWFLDLDARGRQHVRRVLDWNLPGPLDAYLDLCGGSQGLDLLSQRLNPTLPIPAPPSSSAVTRFGALLASTPSTSRRPSPAIRWADLIEVVRATLQLPEVYVLVDGLDATPATAADNHSVASLLAPLVEASEGWRSAHVYLKGFAPLGLRRFFESAAPIPVITPEWTAEQLTALVRRRVYVASHGAYGSLAALSSPALVDVEHQLAERAGTPREMLVLTQRVLVEHMRQAAPWSLLAAADVAAACAWYTAHRPPTRVG